jgi:pimeloyl-ACP methyl ester carboxylesterase
LSEETGLGVIAYSRAGYGQSDPVPLPRPLDYMTREAEDSLGAVLDHLNIKQAILLGHSDGATIAALYAGGIEDFRVRGQILIAPHFFTEPMGLKAIAAAKDAYENGDLRDRLATHHANVDVTFKGWNDAWLAPGFVEWNVGECIDYLRMPSLVIQGEADPYGTMAQIEEVIERSYAPVDELRLPGVGHAPHLEAIDQTILAIKEFCARLVRIEQEQVAL